MLNRAAASAKEAAKRIEADILEQAICLIANVLI